jgi:preprotein translocase subunit SecG
MAEDKKWGYIIGPAIVAGILIVVGVIMQATTSNDLSGIYNRTTSTLTTKTWPLMAFWYICFVLILGLSFVFAASGNTGIDDIKVNTNTRKLLFKRQLESLKSETVPPAAEHAQKAMEAAKSYDVITKCFYAARIILVTAKDTKTPPNRNRRIAIENALKEIDESEPESSKEAVKKHMESAKLVLDGSSSPSRPTINPNDRDVNRIRI